MKHKSSLLENLETADLAYYFASNSENINEHVSQWYANQSPQHSVVRKWIESFEGKIQELKKINYTFDFQFSL